METCPKCGTRFIQYDNINDEFYCLNRLCGYRWEDNNIDLKHIENMYLRISIND